MCAVAKLPEPAKAAPQAEEAASPVQAASPATKPAPMPDFDLSKDYFRAELDSGGPSFRIVVASFIESR